MKLTKAVRVRQPKHGNTGQCLTEAAFALQREHALSVRSGARWGAFTLWGSFLGHYVLRERDFLGLHICCHEDRVCSLKDVLEPRS